MKAALQRLIAGIFLALVVAAQAQGQRPCNNLLAKDVHEVEYGKAFKVPLRVKCALLDSGLHRSMMNGFDLAVTAAFLGEEKPKDAAAAKLLKPISVNARERWFRRDLASRMAYRFAQVPKMKAFGDDAGQAKLDSAEVDGRKLTFLLDEPLTNFVVRFPAVMSKHDTADLGCFDFQPERPGFYRLRLEVTSPGRPMDSLTTHVYFACPAYQLALTVNSERLLHHISYTQVGIPLVSSIFFEKEMSLMSVNSTDAVFRNTFLATLAKRLACGKYAVDLPVLYDRAAGERADLGKKRALLVQNILQDAAGKFANGQACGAFFDLRNPAAPDDWKKYIKPYVSEVSPEMFSQENRVVPVVFDSVAQQVMLAPLQVKPCERSEEVVLTLEVIPASFGENCIHGGKVVVKDEGGAIKEELLSHDRVVRLLRGQNQIKLDSPAMRGFLQHGRFTARVLLSVACPERVVASNEVEFFIERRTNVIRDEIFALNPYDETDFFFKHDLARVGDLADQLLKAARDTLLSHPSPEPPDALVLISGHACILSEVVYRFYNLGLSFGRALFLRDELLKAVRRRSSDYGLEVQLGDELCVAKRSLTKFVSHAKIDSVIKDCLQASDGRALEPLYEGYLERMIREKVRHFEVTSDVCEVKPAPGVPGTAVVRQRIEELKELFPGNILEFSLKSGKKTVKVHLVSVGFGATVPFYRRFEMLPDMHEAFAKINAGEVPTSFYGDDRFPAGRLMNRRVEVNIIW